MMKPWIKQIAHSTLCCSLLWGHWAVAQDNRPSEKEILLEKTFIEASREKILGNYQEAIAQYLEVLKKDNENAPANYELAQLYLMVDQPDQALMRAERAVTLVPLYIDYTRFYATLLDKDGNAKRAADLYDPLVKAYPKDESLYYEWSDYLVKSLRHDQAIKVLDGMEKLLGMREEAVLRKSEAYQRLDKAKKAIEEVERLANQYPAFVDFQLHVARLYQKLQQADKAGQWYERVLKLEPDNAAGNLFMADKFLSQKDTLKYLNALSVMLEKGEMGGADKLSAVKAVAGSTTARFQATLLQLSQMIAAQYPELAGAHLLYGKLLLRSNQYAAAAEEYVLGLDADKNQWESWVELLELYHKAGNEKELLTASLEAIELFPNYPEGYYYAGQAYYKKREYNKAAEQLEYALPMTGSRPEWKTKIQELLGQVKNH